MPKDWEEFKNKMVKSYAHVHNQRYWKEITPHVKDMAKGRVLDIGCGPGLLLRDMLKRFDSKFLYGIDLSQIMLDKAQKVLEEETLPSRFQLLLQHMQEETALPDNLDLVVSSRVMRSFDNIDEVIQSIHNSLVEKGKIVILDWAQASLYQYFEYLSDSRQDGDKLEPKEIISYHRNFSRYSLADWKFILEAFNFNIVHSFASSEVQNCIIGEKN